MSRLEKIVLLGKKFTEAAKDLFGSEKKIETIASEVKRVEPSVVAEAVEAGTKPQKTKYTLEQVQRAKQERLAAEQEAIAAEALATKRTAGKALAIENLDALTPGRYSRQDLDARLAKLTATAKEHGLIDDKIVRESNGFIKDKIADFSKAKNAEDALRNGRPITSEEMSALQTKKLSDFNKWETATTDTAIKNQQKASGTKTIWDKVKTGGLWVAGVGAAVTGLHLTGVLDDTPVGRFITSRSGAIAANAEAAEQTAKLAAAQAERNNCFQVTGGRFADDNSKECLSPAFGKGYNKLTTLFMEAQGWKASELKYLNAMGQKIEQIDDAFPNKTSEKDRNDYQNALAKGHEEVVKQIKSNFKPEDAPDTAKVDMSISKAMGWAYSERAPGS